MAISEELHRLDELRSRGVLTEEEFQRAKARALDADLPAVEAIAKFRRSRDDKWLGGVCGGLGRSTGVESWIWRLLFALLFLFAGSGLVAYLLLWIFVPIDRSAFH